VGFALEKKLVAFVSIALLVGLGIGYVINEVVYQPQLRYLRSSVDELKSVVDDFADYKAKLDNLTAEISRLNSLIAKLNSTQPQSTPKNNETNSPLPYEMLQLLSVNSAKNDSNFEVSFVITNIGTAYAVLEVVFLNGIPQPYVSELSSIVINGTSLSPADLLIWPLGIGDSANGTLTLTGGGAFASGTQVDVAFRTAPRMNYYNGTTVLP
jgi:hypothetical protein